MMTDEERIDSSVRAKLQHKLALSSKGEGASNVYASDDYDSSGESVLDDLLIDRWNRYGIAKERGTLKVLGKAQARDGAMALGRNGNSDRVEIGEDEGGSGDDSSSSFVMVDIDGVGKRKRNLESPRSGNKLYTMNGETGEGGGGPHGKSADLEEDDSESEAEYNDDLSMEIDDVLERFEKSRILRAKKATNSMRTQDKPSSNVPAAARRRRREANQLEIDPESTDEEERLVEVAVQRKEEQERQRRKAERELALQIEHEENERARSESELQRAREADIRRTKARTETRRRKRAEQLKEEEELIRLAEEESRRYERVLEEKRRQREKLIEERKKKRERERRERELQAERRRQRRDKREKEFQTRMKQEFEKQQAAEQKEAELKKRLQLEREEEERIREEKLAVLEKEREEQDFDLARKELLRRRREELEREKLELEIALLDLEEANRARGKGNLKIPSSGLEFRRKRIPNPNSLSSVHPKPLKSGPLSAFYKGLFQPRSSQGQRRKQKTVYGTGDFTSYTHIRYNVCGDSVPHGVEQKLMGMAFAVLFVVVSFGVYGVQELGDRVIKAEVAKVLRSVFGIKPRYPVSLTGALFTATFLHRDLEHLNQDLIMFARLACVLIISDNRPLQIVNLICLSALLGGLATWACGDVHLWTIDLELARTGTEEGGSIAIMDPNGIHVGSGNVVSALYLYLILRGQLKHDLVSQAISWLLLLGSFAIWNTSLHHYLRTSGNNPWNYVGGCFSGVIVALFNTYPFY